MLGWLRCTRRDDAVGRYFNPYAERECAAFSAVSADQAEQRRGHIRAIDNRKTAEIAKIIRRELRNL